MYCPKLKRAGGELRLSCPAVTSASGCSADALVALFGRQRSPVRPPVDHADEQSAARDIAQGDGDEVVDGKVAPGQAGQRLGGQAGSLGEKLIARSHDARRDVVHIGDAVLETGGDEQPDGEEDAQHLAGLAAGAPAEPDRQTDEPVAH